MPRQIGAHQRCRLDRQSAPAAAARGKSIDQLHHARGRLRAGLQIVKVARPVLESLAASTGENIYLGVRQARGIAYADAREAESGVMARFPLGVIRPLHASSPGKVFLAFQAAPHAPPPPLDGVLGPDPLAAFTRHTITDRVTLRRQIEAVRERGYSVNEQEAVDDAYGISAPVFAADGTLAGCITIGLPGVRFKQRRALAIEKAIEAAAEISRRLGVESWQAAVRAFATAR